jgi:hypothetical protein
VAQIKDLREVPREQWGTQTSKEWPAGSPSTANRVIFLEILSYEPGQVECLLPQFGNSCRFEKPSLLRASERVKIWKGMASRVQYLPLVIHVKTKEKGIGSCQAAQKELNDQRIVKLVIWLKLTTRSRAVSPEPRIRMSPA